MRISPLFCCLILCLAWTSVGHGGQDTSLERILTQAQALELYQDPYWHVLVHYQKQAGRYKSRVDDPDFFLAPDGGSNPQAELQATITALFQPPEPDVTSPICKFPARYAWLFEKLGSHVPDFPYTPCPRFEEIYTSMDPDSAVLIFPTAHINSPASMFGHTLLALESADKSRLLAHAVNYSAITAERTWGPIYAVKGLFGGYKGYFSMLPYYEKIQEYSDVSHRDMWEYPLNLTKEELRLLLLHLYELDNIYSDYFFVDENCAFNLLYLVDAARQGSELANQCPYLAVPVDTVRLLEKNRFIEGKPTFRPSKMTRISDLRAGLSRSRQQLALDVAGGGTAPADIGKLQSLSREEKAQTLDLAGELISYQYTRKKLDVSTYTQRYRSTLAARASLGKWEAPSSNTPASPDQGHLSSKVWLGGGVDDDKGFARLGFRPLFHGFDDNARGYEKGAQILIMDTALDYFPDKGRVDLHHLDILDIFSIAPRDNVFKSLSWRVGTGFHQMMEEDGTQGTAYTFNLGGGIAKNLPFSSLGYLMAEADLAVSPGLDMAYGIGPGLRAGILSDPTPWLRLNLQAKGTFFGLGDCHTVLDYSIGATASTSQNTGLNAKILFREAREFSHTQASMNFNLYF